MSTAPRQPSGTERPTGEAVRGLRELDDVPGYRRTSELVWHADDRMWALHFTLRVPVPPEEIKAPDLPEVTAWVARFAAEYPHGRIEIFPAADGGIADTYPHQKPNLAPQDGRPWRRGELCVTTPFAAFARAGYDTEPRAAATRLTWYLDRTRQWVDAARRGKLLDTGEPFELPVYAPDGSSPLLVFESGAADLAHWARTTDASGLATLVTPDWNSRLRVVATFGGPASPTQAADLPSPRWGKELRGPWKVGQEEVAVWVRLPDVPAIKPWRAPATWGELVECLRAQDIELLRALEPAARALRDGKPHLMLLGAPLPVRVGGPATVLHWLAIRLPVLSHKEKVKRGYRPGERGYWLRDQMEVFRSGMTLSWVATENWSPEEIATRGRAAPALRQTQVLLIGAGALGSLIAELLVREGVVSVNVMDGDSVTVGNLVRHTLGLGDVGQPKAQALADRLNSVNPHARVVAVNSTFPGGGDGEAALRAAGLVIDCTADDAVIAQLAGFDWGAPKHFASCAVGLFAKRLFMFTARGDRFPEQEFAAMVNPWILAEREEFSEVELPWEATGCWHPVFPARASDFALFAAAVVRRLEAFMIRSDEEPMLNVLEQRLSADGILELQEARLPSERRSA